MVMIFKHIILVNNLITLVFCLYIKSQNVTSNKEKMKDFRNFIATTIREYLNEYSNALLAPNGSKSKLPKNLYNFVRINEFKKWFGGWENNSNNSSRIVDENGEPMLVYHGTKIKFNQFDLDKQKIGWLGKGFYFTNDKGATKEYGKSTMKIFLNIRNPFIIKGESPNKVFAFQFKFYAIKPH